LARWWTVATYSGGAFIPAPTTRAAVTKRASPAGRAATCVPTTWGIKSYSPWSIWSSSPCTSYLVWFLINVASVWTSATPWSIDLGS
jgi:hypothetical protein